MLVGLLPPLYFAFQIFFFSFVFFCSSLISFAVSWLHWCLSAILFNQTLYFIIINYLKLLYCSKWFHFKWWFLCSCNFAQELSIFCAFEITKKKNEEKRLYVLVCVTLKMLSRKYEISSKYEVKFIACTYATILAHKSFYQRNEMNNKKKKTHTHEAALTQSHKSNYLIFPLGKDEILNIYFANMCVLCGV